MSTVSIIDRAPTARRTIWSEVDDGFFVANRDGEFVGSVDRTGVGRFAASDGRSACIGLYDTLIEAQRAVLGAENAPVRARSTSAHTALVATVTGSLATMLLIAAAVQVLLV